MREYVCFEDRWSLHIAKDLLEQPNRGFLDIMEYYATITYECTGRFTGKYKPICLYPVRGKRCFREKVSPKKSAWGNSEIQTPLIRIAESMAGCCLRK